MRAARGALTVGAVALLACAREAPTGPYLVARAGDAEPATTTAAAATAVDPATVALALGGLPDGAAGRLAEALATATDAAVRQAAPILFADLDDRAADRDPLRSLLPSLPALTAASNLRGAPWRSTGLTVTLAPSCDARAARCVRLFTVDAREPAPASAAPEDALPRRARGLAWSLGDAALLRPAPSLRAATIDALRHLPARADSSVALVFTASSGALPAIEIAALRRAATRALAHVDERAPQRAWLDALARCDGRWQLPVTLADGVVLVVPRLSSLARPRTFTAEIATTGPLEWLARPAPPPR